MLRVLLAAAVLVQAPTLIQQPPLDGIVTLDLARADASWIPPWDQDPGAPYWKADKVCAGRGLLAAVVYTGKWHAFCAKTDREAIPLGVNGGGPMSCEERLAFALLDVMDVADFWKRGNWSKAAKDQADPDARIEKARAVFAECGP